MLILLAYLIRRWLAVTLLIAVLLSVMLLLLTLAEAASDVAAGHLPPGLFWWQLLLSLPEAMGIVAPLAVTGGLIVSLGQAALDREWVVMRASGLAFRHLLAMVITTGLVFTLAMLAVTGYLQPMSHQYQQQLKSEAARSAQLWGMQPGRFVEIPGMDGVAYVASLDDDGFVLHDLFLVVRKEGRDEVLTATSGHYRQAPDGERYIELTQGQRIELPDTGLAVRNARFGGGVLQIPQQSVSGQDDSLAGLSLWELLRVGDEAARREMNWRLSAPISVFVLSLFGFICAAWGNGEGRGWRALLGILVYVAYLQAIGLARVRIGAGAWESLSLYWVHMSFLMTASLLLLWMSRRY